LHGSEVRSSEPAQSAKTASSGETPAGAPYRRPALSALPALGTTMAASQLKCSQMFTAQSLISTLLFLGAEILEAQCRIPNSAQNRRTFAGKSSRGAAMLTLALEWRAANGTLYSGFALQFTSCIQLAA
jgi:hypothetical protein